LEESSTSKDIRYSPLSMIKTSGTIQRTLDKAPLYRVSMLTDQSSFSSTFLPKTADPHHFWHQAGHCSKQSDVCSEQHLSL